jgi:hypothetical protein
LGKSLGNDRQRTDFNVFVGLTSVATLGPADESGNVAVNSKVVGVIE